jgi:hypothetical protein
MASTHLLHPANGGGEGGVPSFGELKNRQADHRKRVDALTRYLSEAGNLFGGSVIVPSVLSALTTIEEFAAQQGGLPLWQDDRDTLLGLMMAARENILDLIKDQGTAQIVIAAASVDAACALLICWNDLHRFERPRGFVNEMRDRVCFLRNVFANLALQERFSRGEEITCANPASSLTPAPSTKGRRYG